MELNNIKLIESNTNNDEIKNEFYNNHSDKEELFKIDKNKNILVNKENILNADKYKIQLKEENKNVLKQLEKKKIINLNKGENIGNTAKNINNTNKKGIENISTNINSEFKNIVFDVKAHIEKKDVEIVEIFPDGNCLYRSISFFFI